MFFLNDGQAKASTFAGRFGSEKGFKQCFQAVIRRKPRAVICHSDGQCSGIRLGADANLALRCLQGVAQQVEQGQFQTPCIGAEGRQRRRNMRIQRSLGGIQFGTYGFDDAFNQQGRGNVPWLGGGGT